VPQKFFSYAHSKSSNESEFLYYREEKKIRKKIEIMVAQ
jgi:hypothetical protein